MIKLKTLLENDARHGVVPFMGDIVSYRLPDGKEDIGRVSAPVQADGSFSVNNRKGETVDLNVKQLIQIEPTGYYAKVSFTPMDSFNRSLQA